MYIDLRVRVLTEYLGFRIRVLKKWYSSCTRVRVLYSSTPLLSTDVEEEYEVKFLRRSEWGGFTFPNVADICDVAKSDVVLKLPCPQSSGETARAG